VSEGISIFDVITRADEETLDRYEGVPSVYSKQIVQIEQGRTIIPMLILISRDGLKGLPPPGFLERFVGAAVGWGMLEGYVGELRGWIGCT
jgi:hypothetical protein